MKNRYCVWVLASMGCLFSLEAQADAANNFVLNKTAFFSNDQVVLDLGALTIDGSDTFVPASNIFVVPAGLTLDGTTFLPALDPSGLPNVIQGFGGGGFIQEPLGFTKPAGSIGAGTWDIVEDHNQNNIFDLGDSVLRNAFTVNLATNVPPIMTSSQIAAIKLRAASSRAQLQEAKAILDTARFLAGGVGNVAENGVEGALQYAREQLISQYIPCLSALSCALDYLNGLIPETPIEWGLNVIDDLVADSVGHYSGIAADPPDPDFQQVTQLAARIPVVAGASDPFDVPSANFYRALQDEAATAQSFLKAMERYQGADAVGNGDWALLHARQLRAFSGLLAENLGATNTALSGFVAALNADARDLDGIISSFESLTTFVQANGLSAEQQQGLANLGFSEQQIEALRLEILAQDLSAWSKAGLIASFDALRSNNLTFILELNDLVAFLDGIIASLIADPLVEDIIPAADAGGPYLANEGAVLVLDASASTPGSGASQIVSYEWDTDADGAFDDASGVQANVTLNANHSGVLGLKVTNELGHYNIDYASVTVADTNPAPVIISVTPLDLQPTVLIGSPQLFFINANDAFSIEWQLDGVVVATGSSFNFAPVLGDVGLHSLVAEIDDGTADGGTTTQTWTVSVLEVDGDGDGFTLTGGDCDDSAAAVNPAASEVIDNGIDDDCNPATEDADQPPMAASITFPFLGMDGEPLEFLNRSSDANGDIVSFVWDFGDGTTSNEENPFHQFPALGIFPVTLTVTDSQGNVSVFEQAVEITGPRSLKLVSDPDTANQDTLGRFGDGHTVSGHDVSEDGKWVAFVSAATNLITNDVNGRRLDVFVQNVASGETIVITKHDDGTQAVVPPTGNSIFQMVRGLDMSRDGRFIVFASTALNLIGEDADGDGACDTCDQPTLYAIFVHDRDTDGNGVYDEPGGFSTERIASAGAAVASYISDNGQFVAFQSTVRDIEYIGSENESLPGGNITTAYIFLHDRSAGTTQLITRQLNGLPGSGSFPALGSLSRTSQEALSGDGTQIVFLAGLSGFFTGEDTDDDGRCDVGCPNGRANNLYVYNGHTGKIIQVNVNRLGQLGVEGGDFPRAVDMSADGRFIVFSSGDDNLIVDDQDVVLNIPGRAHLYLKDRDSDENGIFDEPGGTDIDLISVNADGAISNTYNRSGSVSDDGRHVLFIGALSTLIGPPFTGGTGPVLRDRAAGRTVLAFTNIFGQAPGLLSGTRDVRMSSNARYVLTSSFGSDMLGIDVNNNNRCRDSDGDIDCKTNQLVDVFLVDRDPDGDGLIGDEDTCFNSLPGSMVDELGCAPDASVAITKSPATQQVQPGGTAAFTINVFSNGGVDLHDIDVADLLAPDCESQTSALAADGQFSYDCVMPGITADTTNVATVTALPTLGEAVNDSASADVVIIHPDIDIAQTPEVQNVLADIDFLLTMTVTNRGDVSLSNVTVSDALVPGCDKVLGTLASGEQVSYRCLALGVQQDFTNIATVVGLPPVGIEVAANDSTEVIVGAAVDLLPPELTLPPSTTLEATSGAGAVHTYIATATDDLDPAPVVSCLPSPGSTFPLGMTTVNCSTTDTAGNSAEGSFDVTVEDTTSPDLSLPVDAVLETGDEGGAVHAFNVSAVDIVDPAPTVTCTPPSGSLFPIGTTSVDCSTEDAAGNSSNGSFSVMVNLTSVDVPAVTDLSVRAKRGKVQLTWSHAGVASYNVYRGDNGAVLQLIGNTTSTYSVFIDSGLANGIEYCYVVRSVNAQSVEADDSNEVCVTPASRRSRRR